MRSFAEGQASNNAVDPSGASGLARRDVLALSGAAALAATTPASGGCAAPVSTSAAIEPTSTATIRLIVNGKEASIEVDPRRSLLDVLRETLNLTGTKKGCNQGACGAPSF